MADLGAKRRHSPAEGHGTPVFIELYKGELRVIVWADINQEDPTHIIPLGGFIRSRCANVS